MQTVAGVGGGAGDSLGGGIKGYFQVLAVVGRQVVMPLIEIGNNKF